MKEELLSAAISNGSISQVVPSLEEPLSPIICHRRPFLGCDHGNALIAFDYLYKYECSMGLTCSTYNQYM